MYINSLGTIARINTHTQRNNTNRLSNANNFSNAMKKAIEGGNDTKTKTPSVLNGGVLITADAFERMKTDPEWANQVIDELKSHYSVGGSKAETTGLQIIEGTGKDSYISSNLIGQFGLQSYPMQSNLMQSYLMQRLISGQSSLGTLSPFIDTSGYYSSVPGSLAATAYGNSKNSLLTTSLLGSMFI